MAAFQKQAMEDFETRAVRHLRRNLPKPTAKWSDDDLRRRVRECIPRAKEYDLVSEQQVICFVDTSYLLGENFDKDSKYDWSPELLKSTELSPRDKAHRLRAAACNIYKNTEVGK